MILRYKQDDGTIRDFTLRPGELLSPEVEAIENVGGSAWDTFDEWGEKFMKGNRRAYRAGLWIMLKRTDPMLKFKDLAVRADSITWDFDPDEQEKIKEEIRRTGEELDPDQKETLLSIMGALAGKEAGNPSENFDGSTDSESVNDSTQV